ncbi:MAG: OprD family outer membrane porin [Saprospiraceae bacterium]|nr:OprD family outer membrane porin [Saprospiraceae bacterium]
MRRYFFWLLLFTVRSGAGLFAQAAPADTVQSASTLREIFSKGIHAGHFRSFLMITDNEPGLSDYYALAAGGDLHFQSAALEGFSFGIGGNFNFNLASSDLSKKDPLSGAANRYELGLFDVENPTNKTDLDRMDEFKIRYQNSRLIISLGKQGIQTPFINFQDGRMRPTAVNGLWNEIRLSKNALLTGGWLWGISPRSTVRWYKIGASIGVYPSGLNPDGSASGYPQHLQTKGIALLGFKKSFGKNWNLQIWDQYVDHIFNTFFAQTEWNTTLNNTSELRAGLQSTIQHPLAEGGNPELDKTYFPVNQHALVVSSMVGFKHHRFDYQIAYTRAADEGRFLMPREWGREPFYTFMARERMEGSGNVHAVTVRVNWQSKSKQWKTGVAYGHFYLPDVKDVAMNKYAFPAFRQFNADFRYAFGGIFKGLHAQFLYVWKGQIGETYGNNRLVINRVNMSHFNLILNYFY